jgi:hypothetical protein
MIAYCFATLLTCKGKAAQAAGAYACLQKCTYKKFGVLPLKGQLTLISNTQQSNAAASRRRSHLEYLGTQPGSGVPGTRLAISQHTICFALRGKLQLVAMIKNVSDHSARPACSNSLLSLALMYHFFLPCSAMQCLHVGLLKKQSILRHCLVLMHAADLPMLQTHSGLVVALYCIT